MPDSAFCHHRNADASMILMISSGRSYGQFHCCADICRTRSKAITALLRRLQRFLLVGINHIHDHATFKHLSESFFTANPILLVPCNLQTICFLYCDCTTNRSSFVLSGCLFESGYQFAIEVRDIRHDSAPHLVAITKSRFVHPGGTSVQQIVLDAQRSNSLLTGNNFCGNRQQAAMANDADDLALFVDFGNQIGGLLIAPHLIRSPTAR